ncbi:DNA mismatch repair protein MutS [Clostridium sp. D2Q-11]|uniref:DNA mismatch repair protein MutS n=1 Tax=Anaeromonas frigoriresistens TaxID=2683708 RepID=A0A942V4X0_9FIRM|nr:DNA mismatch repair protein MutS [Anaeromonas frigoriresistens]MBS4539927.1 DNA mismatch repair protein MutS [Anaeromonas frigoriresistens]
MGKLTPMMQQYMDIKNKNKDSVLFFRLGDFYEMFFEDAITASKELEITLTGRECGQKEKAPMCGVPYHSADGYIAKLVSKGYKVAICEQVEDAQEAKGIVKRDIVRIVTPGTITDSKMLDEKDNNYLASAYLSEKGMGISYVDITTGELYTTEKRNVDFNLIRNSMVDELAKIKPREVIVNKYLYDTRIVKDIEDKFNSTVNEYHEWIYNTNESKKVIKNHFKVLNLEGYGLGDSDYSIKSTGALLQYLEETQKTSLKHINNISQYSIDNFMILDINTRRNLEITETIRDKTKKGSLLWVLDKTATSMGARMLKKWIEQPLLNKSLINERLNGIESLINNLILMGDIKENLKEIYDIERLMGRISYGSSNARDMIALKNSINVLPQVRELLIESNCDYFKKLATNIDLLPDIYELINKSIVDDPPISIKDGGIIKKGYNDSLDELITASTEGKKWLSQLETTEKSRTGIKSLKVGFNKVFGYYIEVTKSNLNLVPDNYTRKQTLSNSERYITPELKEMESKILGAEEKSTILEYKLFNEIRDLIRVEIERIQNTARIISNIDALNSLAQVAYKNNYIRPNINDKGIIEIKNGRHPVVEKVLDGDMFIPNNTLLDKESNRLNVITGPNMAGKSTYMRQVAIINLMAQIGSFVPAEYANISLVDRIFTRVGASDDLSQGQSTFMVEMSEVANILNNSSSDSLVILDEIGRGTSTYDGLSIAWAVIEYIGDKNNIGAKTLFSTHYHELTELEGSLDGVKNYKITVKEDGEDIIFLRKVVRGEADKSYGIEVANLAGVPSQVISRAKMILKELEKSDINYQDIDKELIVHEEVALDSNSLTASEENQIDMFNFKKQEIIEMIKDIELINITPLQSMNILNDLINKTKEI